MGRTFARPVGLAHPATVSKKHSLSQDRYCTNLPRGRIAIDDSVATFCPARHSMAELCSLWDRHRAAQHG
jgi:hypothetical protein